MTVAADLTAARAVANRTRGDWLISLSEGLASVADLIAYAAGPDGAPLRAITIRRLMATQHGWGERRRKQLVRELALVCPTSMSASRLSVGWLIDSRACGRRLVAFSNLIKPHGPPWPGFPLTHKPAL
ncbi:hypothetical protein [Leucobacter sp. cx-169]|uniref:hypothetical protein n=1 Tax=Leucobacter sp. cx-169 TaxID=2770549 RepID=UPI00165DFE1F|nr:hypothetical protein [Leucobacter sp. cx-169]MBC9927337.1 hypothetical protein [Leucobacter sp. cx-169]